MNPWTALLDLLGRILSFSYDFIPSFGVAIIFLTLLVSLILFPLTLKQTRSMRSMQEIQPEVKRLQKELKGDREELNKQLMALYQERGVNPAAGCLPLILQMPIWFALFRVLNINTADPAGHIPTDSALWASLVDGRQSFLGMDLLRAPSAAIADGFVTALPYLILIAFVVATSYYQQYQTTRRRTPVDDPKQQQQQQTMQTVMKIMPVFFGFISWTLPAGLVTYFAVSGLFRIGQQAVIIRLDDEHAAEKAAGEGSSGRSGTSTGEEPEPPKSSGPSPNTSKKRKKRRRK
jgi:YidC/Oxa1 family membrane protein insertase